MAKAEAPHPAPARVTATEDLDDRSGRAASNTSGRLFGALLRRDFVLVNCALRNTVHMARA